jgi:hypothetical protein
MAQMTLSEAMSATLLPMYNEYTAIDMPEPALERQADGAGATITEVSNN